MQSGFDWYVTKSRITMVIVHPPDKVLLGSPLSERGRDDSDEAQWYCDIDWTYAISAYEITQSNSSAYPEYEEYLNDFAVEMNCPANAVSWLDATKYCRLLSERDGISSDEMAIPSIENLEQGPYPDFATRCGYRLP